MVHENVIFLPDPKLTESFLLSQDGVLDASAWIERGRLCAHVTLLDSLDLSALEVQNLCREQIGENNTPREVQIVQARLRVA